jgi:hypothetical protein
MPPSLSCPVEVRRESGLGTPVLTPMRVEKDDVRALTARDRIELLPDTRSKTTVAHNRAGGLRPLLAGRTTAAPEPTGTARQNKQNRTKRP